MTLKNVSGRTTVSDTFSHTSRRSVRQTVSGRTTASQTFSERAAELSKVPVLELLARAKAGLAFLYVDYGNTKNVDTAKILADCTSPERHRVFCQKSPLQYTAPWAYEDAASAATVLVNQGSSSSRRVAVFTGCGDKRKAHVEYVPVSEGDSRLQFDPSHFECSLQEVAAVLQALGIASDWKIAARVLQSRQPQLSPSSTLPELALQHDQKPQQAWKASQEAQASADLQHPQSKVVAIVTAAICCFVLWRKVSTCTTGGRHHKN
jgi:hypothetical protein